MTIVEELVTPDGTLAQIIEEDGRLTHVRSRDGVELSRDDLGPIPPEPEPAELELGLDARITELEGIVAALLGDEP